MEQLRADYQQKWDKRSTRLLDQQKNVASQKMRRDQRAAQLARILTALREAEKEGEKSCTPIIELRRNELTLIASELIYIDEFETDARLEVAELRRRQAFELDAITTGLFYHLKFGHFAGNEYPDRQILAGLSGRLRTKGLAKRDQPQLREKKEADRLRRQIERYFRREAGIRLLMEEKNTVWRLFFPFQKLEKKADSDYWKAVKTQREKDLADFYQANPCKSLSGGS